MLYIYQHASLPSTWWWWLSSFHLNIYDGGGAGNMWSTVHFFCLFIRTLKFHAKSVHIYSTYKCFKLQPPKNVVDLSWGGNKNFHPVCVCMLCAWLNLIASSAFCFAEWEREFDIEFLTLHSILHSHTIDLKNLTFFTRNYLYRERERDKTDFCHAKQIKKSSQKVEEKSK